MLRLIFFLIFLVASVWVGIEVVRHPGFLFISYQPWMIQMPLWFALLSFITFVILFYFLITSVDKIGFAWYRFKNWLSIRREHKSYSKTQLGMTALIEGRWKKAEKLLIDGIDQSHEPLMNYLSAAKAAHAQGAFDRRDHYLQKSYEVAPKAELAVGLTQADLEYNQEKFEQAAATLNHLRECSPRHPEVIKKLEKVYVRLGDWKHLQQLLPAMRKTKIVTPREYELFEKNIYCELFNHADNHRLSQIREMWQQMPRYLRKNPAVVEAYVKQLAKHAPITGIETTKEIEELIRQVLKHTWSPTLARLYGTLSFQNWDKQLIIVSAWVKMYGQQPELSLLLGKICARLQLWGRAKEYFSRCMVQGFQVEAALEYGKLLEQLGDKEEAVRIYKEGLIAELTPAT